MIFDDDSVGAAAEELATPAFAIGIIVGVVFIIVAIALW